MLTTRLEYVTLTRNRYRRQIMLGKRQNNDRIKPEEREIKLSWWKEKYAPGN